MKKIAAREQFLILQPQLYFTTFLNVISYTGKKFQCQFLRLDIRFLSSLQVKYPAYFSYNSCNKERLFH